MSSASSSPARVSGAPSHLFWAVLSLLIGALLRLYAASGELWFDEIWNLHAVRRFDSLLELYLSPTLFDGHSSLYSAYLWFCGAERGSLALRALSVLASLALLIFLPQRLCQERRVAEMLRLLFATSYFFVLFGTEARGYSAMLFFGLGAYAALLSLWRLPRLWSAAVYCCCSLLSLHFHFSAVLFLLAASAAELYRFARERSKLWLMVLVHLPLFWTAFVYLFWARGLPSGGGPVVPYARVLIDTLSLSIGGPLTSAYTPTANLFAGLSAGLALAIFVSELIELFRRGQQQRALYLGTLLCVAPTLMLMLHQPLIIAPRYFLPSVAAGLVLLAGFIARCYFAGSRFGRLLAILLFCLWSYGNTRQLIPLLEHGRASYRPMLRELASAAEEGTLLLDHEARHSLMLEYAAEDEYTPLVPQGLDSIEELPKSAPLLLLQHSIDGGWTPDKEQNIAGRNFALQDFWPSASLSGWPMALYRSAPSRDAEGRE